MRWSRALIIWLVIVLAESVHGTLRQLFIAPLLGDLPARQLGVFIGCAIIFLVAWSGIRWIGAKSLREQLQVGAVWVVLIVIFEVALGLGLGYSRERMLSDYNLGEGGLMGLGLLFLLFAPAMAAKARGVSGTSSSGRSA